MKIFSARRSWPLLSRCFFTANTVEIIKFSVESQSHAGCDDCPKKNRRETKLLKHLTEISQSGKYPFVKNAIIKVDRRDVTFRLTVPRRIILYKKWDDVEYVMVEESGPDLIVLRRFVDGEALRTTDQGTLPGFNR